MVKSRDELEEKMVAVFGEEIKELSTELQEILIDDLVTAFENRINVLNRIQIRRTVWMINQGKSLNLTSINDIYAIIRNMAEGTYHETQ